MKWIAVVGLFFSGLLVAVSIWRYADQAVYRKFFPLVVGKDGGIEVINKADGKGIVWSKRVVEGSWLPVRPGDVWIVIQSRVNIWMARGKENKASKILKAIEERIRMIGELGERGELELALKIALRVEKYINEVVDTLLVAPVDENETMRNLWLSVDDGMMDFEWELTNLKAQLNQEAVAGVDSLLGRIEQRRVEVREHLKVGEKNVSVEGTEEDTKVDGGEEQEPMF